MSTASSSHAIPTIRRHSPGWLVSLVLHLLLLAVMAGITWTLPRMLKPDAIITLGDEGLDATSGGSGGAGGAKAGSSKNAASAAPSKQTPAPSSGQTSPIPVPSPDSSASSALQDSLGTLASSIGSVSASSGSGGSSLLPSAGSSSSGGSSSASSGASTGGGLGNGLLDGVGSGFGQQVGKLRRSGLDIVLVLDATDSMDPYIDQAKTRLLDIVSVVQALVPGSRIGVVAFKDYGDDYGPQAVRALRITDDVQEVRQFIDHIVPGGGGAQPEPTHEALAAATDSRMGWKSGRKQVIILVSDAPVHASSRDKAFQVARDFAARGDRTINVIDVGGTGDSNRRSVLSDLARIAQEGQGSAFFLRDAQAFWSHLIVSVFGQQYRNDIDTILKKYTQTKEP